MIGHPKCITKLLSSADGQYFFTLGESDSFICMWQLNLNCAKENLLKGGENLAPFCYALPGGRSGWLFQEMQDLFYYMQIISKSSDGPEEQVVDNEMAMTEVADFMRGLGFFPSEFDVNNMLLEFSGKWKITFEALVALYINHKPAFGYRREDIVKPFLHFVHKEEDKNNENLMLDRDRLLEICTDNGECMNRIEIAKHLANLMTDETSPSFYDSSDSDEITYNLLYNCPEIFSVEDFIKIVLGLDSKISSEPQDTHMNK